MKELEPSEILRRAHAVGTYYGFVPFSSLAAKRSRSASLRKDAKKVAPYPDSINLETLDPFAREVAMFLKQLRDSNLSPSPTQPLFVWHSNAAGGRPSPRSIVVQFHALGVDRAIADAVLIRAVRSFVADLTKEEPKLRINSMGDKETRARLARELGQFFRKNAPSLSEACTASLKRDLFEAAEHIEDGELRASLPSPTDHLSEASRKHFEAVLEYLEATDTAYELAPGLMPRAAYWTETCFETRVNEHVHAWGSRYGELARLFFKSAVPSIGAVVRITVPGKPMMSPVKERSAPRFVFVHIGDEAKRASIKITDTLRRARIPLTQAIGIESLTEQMRLAEILNPPYLLIMGRKEALERSVILRERATHTETFIPFDALVDELRAV